jgi:O-acetyl-ADP-ribose deacetylase (regulator of RNase III)
MGDWMAGEFICLFALMKVHEFRESFDAYISIELGPKDDEYAITHICQTALYERWKGYCPAGNCLIVPLEGTICPTNRFDCGFIALCPTMRVPESVRWDKEVVYECMWSLLNALDHYNQEVRSRGQGREIKKVLMTGLATGVGRISPATCAMQMAVAVKHYHEALENKEKWSRLEWPEIYQLTNESRDP